MAHGIAPGYLQEWVLSYLPLTYNYYLRDSRKFYFIIPQTLTKCLCGVHSVCCSVCASHSRFQPHRWIAAIAVKKAVCQSSSLTIVSHTERPM